MPKKKRIGVFVDLPESVMKTLEEIPTHEGLPVNEHFRAAALGVVSSILKAQTRRGPGRPVTPIPKLPADIERSDIASGFAGVYGQGKNWRAFWDKGEGPLGTFELPEEAALARYWYNKGIVSRMAVILREEGASHANIVQAARNMGALVPQKPFAVGDLVDYAPTYGSGPIKKGCRIIGGPSTLSDGTIVWQLEGQPNVFQQDLDHALEEGS